MPDNRERKQQAAAGKIARAESRARRDIREKGDRHDSIY